MPKKNPYTPGELKKLKPIQSRKATKNANSTNWTSVIVSGAKKSAKRRRLGR